MKCKIFIKGLLTLVLLLFSLYSNAQEENENNTQEKENVTKKPAAKGYAKFREAGVSCDSGLFILYRTDDKLYFEIPDSVLGKDMLLGSRVSEISSTSKVVAGEMRKSPVLVYLSRDNKNVFLHQVVSDYISDEDDAVNLSVERNSLAPILNTFPVEAFNSDSSAVVIDVTKFFSNEIPAVSPFNAKYKAGKLESEATKITESLSFPGNVEVRTLMSYSNTGSEPFLIVMHRSLLLLPEKPMQPRYEDPRIGYFSNSKRYFSSDKIGVESLSYISRFRLEPRPEDMDRYKAGELVEPEKPIVFYIDNAFPESWRPYLKAGIEDWQAAFEAIGFKNAIQAKDYPTDDPEFHPEDIRYSCIRYISMPKANSMGPRWIDPRSGEVISGDVLWWHNVTVLLRDWRFVQCGAVEPAAREKNINLELLGSMIRYVAAHEVGHTLGLKHNMRASYAFEVDSLRSPTFTNAHGTTPSIMDYARFNYIAQPGDGVTALAPPHMGPYDVFAIKWGYKPIFEAGTPEEEKATLNRWILEKSDSLIYRYGDQQMGLCFDPSSQNEALGNDAIKASEYGVANAKYIMSHLVEWCTEPNGDYEFLSHIYEELIRQYNRYTGHVVSYLGGVYIYKGVEGEGIPFYSPVAKEKQKQALVWLFKSLADEPSWILNPEIDKRLGSQKANLYKSQAATLDMIMSPVILQRLALYHKDYTPYQYLNDVYEQVWYKTMHHKELTPFDRHIQASYVHNLLSLGGKEARAAAPAADPEEDYLGSASSAKVTFTDNLIKPLISQQIRETSKLLEKNLKNHDPETAAHYRYLYSLLRQ